MRTAPMTITFVLLASGLLPSAAAKVTLVRSGVPNATVVTGVDAGDQARDAAQSRGPCNCSWSREYAHGGARP